MKNDISHTSIIPGDLVMNTRTGEMGVVMYKTQMSNDMYFKVFNGKESKEWWASNLKKVKNENSLVNKDN